MNRQLQPRLHLPWVQLSLALVLAVVVFMQVSLPPSTDESHKLASVRDGSICIANEDEDERITYHGDCGTIFMDLDCNGVYLHIEGTAAEPWMSFGVSLWDVMSKHSQLGGASESPEADAPSDKEDETKEGNAKESFHILLPIPAASFNVHVVPPPPRKLDGGSYLIRNITLVPNPNRKAKQV